MICVWFTSLRLIDRQKHAPFILKGLLAAHELENLKIPEFYSTFLPYISNFEENTLLCLSAISRDVSATDKLETYSMNSLNKLVIEIDRIQKCQWIIGYNIVSIYVAGEDKNTISLILRSAIGTYVTKIGLDKLNEISGILGGWVSTKTSYPNAKPFELPDHSRLSAVTLPHWLIIEEQINQYSGIC